MTPERTCPPVPESRKLERGGAVRASGRAERLTASARAAVRGDVAPSNAGGGTVCGRLRWRTEQGPPEQRRRAPAPARPSPGPGEAHFLSLTAASGSSGRGGQRVRALCCHTRRRPQTQRPQAETNVRHAQSAHESRIQAWLRFGGLVRSEPSRQLGDGHPEAWLGQEDLMLRWLAHVLGPSRSRWL